MVAVDDDGAQGPQHAAADGVEHLQRAAREMIAAARSFLDAVEQVVEDNEALRDASSSVSDLVATVVESVRPGGRTVPWADEDQPPSSRSDWTAAAQGSATSSADVVAGPERERVDAETEEWARPLVDDAAPRRPSRVRRIAVD